MSRTSAMIMLSLPTQKSIIELKHPCLYRRPLAAVGNTQGIAVPRCQGRSEWILEQGENRTDRTGQDRIHLYYPYFQSLFSTQFLRTPSLLSHPSDRLSFFVITSDIPSSPRCSPRFWHPDRTTTSTNQTMGQITKKRSLNSLGSFTSISLPVSLSSYGIQWYISSFHHHSPS